MRMFGRFSARNESRNSLRPTHLSKRSFGHTKKEEEEQTQEESLETRHDDDILHLPRVRWIRKDAEHEIHYDDRQQVQEFDQFFGRVAGADRATSGRHTSSHKRLKVIEQHRIRAEQCFVCICHTVRP